jgi:hypothetical protein
MQNFCYFSSTDISKSPQHTILRKSIQWEPGPYIRRGEGTDGGMDEGIDGRS